MPAGRVRSLVRVSCCRRHKPPLEAWLEARCSRPARNRSEQQILVVLSVAHLCVILVSLACRTSTAHTRQPPPFIVHGTWLCSCGDIGHFYDLYRTRSTLTVHGYTDGRSNDTSRCARHAATRQDPGVEVRARGTAHAGPPPRPRHGIAIGVRGHRIGFDCAPRPPPNAMSPFFFQLRLASSPHN
jgi:hypothetical protein